MAKQSTKHDMASIGGDASNGVMFPANMVLETSIASRDPNGRTLQARLGDFPQAAVEKFLRYGFQRVFNDAIGGSDTDAATKVEIAEKLMERFKAGDIGRAVAAGVDAVTKLARRKARAALKATHKGTDVWKRFADMSPADQAAKLDEILGKNGHFRTEAEAELKARADAVVRIDMEGVEL